MKGTSTETRSRASKVAALGAKFAINIAKEKDPSLYKKYQSAWQKYVKMKELIEKKYGKSGLAAARTGGMKKDLPVAKSKDGGK